MEVTANKDGKMPLRPLNQQQTWLLPPTLDELIPDDHPVRFIASLVDTLDDTIWQKMSVDLNGEPLCRQSSEELGMKLWLSPQVW